MNQIDHYKIAKARLLSQWKGKATIDKLLALLFTDGWGHVEAVLIDLFNLTIDNATGVNLDQFGPLLNQPRMGGPYPLGEADADYRAKLKAAIRRNRSCGTDADLRGVIGALLPNNLGVQILPQYPAAIQVQVQVPAPLSADMNEALGGFVRASTSAGVGINGIAVYTDPVFGFAGGSPAIKGFDVGPFAVFV